MSKWMQIRKIFPITCSLLILLNLFSGVSKINAETESLQWHFSKSIDIQVGSKYNEFFLDEEVYARANEDLSDLRIMDSKGQFVPFYMDNGFGEAVEERTVYASNLVNRAKKDNQTSLDFRIHAIRENVDIQGNLLTIELPKEDFLKHVEIYGGYDGNEWVFVKKDNLYRTDQLTKDTIELDSTYKYSYYRMIVLNDVENLDFSKLQLVDTVHSINWSDFKKTAVAVYNSKEEAKQTVITIQNEQCLRVKKIFLDVGGNFVRKYSLLEPNNNEIKVEGKNELYRLDFKNAPIANTGITLTRPITKPYFTLKINNNDNPSLKITGITIEYFVDKLVFEDQGNGPYKLLYGNNEASKPRYDIVNFKSYIQQENRTQGKLGIQVVAQNDAIALPQAWYLQPKLWFNVVLVIVSLSLIVILARKLNRSKT